MRKNGIARTKNTYRTNLNKLFSSIISESIESYYKQDYKERKVLNEPTVMSDGRAEQSVGNILKYFRIDNDFYPL